GQPVAAPEAALAGAESRWDTRLSAGFATADRAAGPGDGTLASRAQGDRHAARGGAAAARAGHAAAALGGGLHRLNRRSSWRRFFLIHSSTGVPVGGGIRREGGWALGGGLPAGRRAPNNLGYVSVLR